MTGTFDTVAVDGGDGTSYGERFVKSDAYAMLKARGMPGDTAWASPEVKVGPMQVKTVLTAQAGSGANLIQPDMRPACCRCYSSG